jgi:ribokinase
VRGCDRPTGTALIFVDERGENTIAVSPGANDALRAEDVPRRLIASADVVVATLEASLEAIDAAFGLARAAGAPTVLNAAPACSVPESLLGLCDVVICNETELASLVAGGGSVAAATDGESVAARVAGKSVLRHRRARAARVAAVSSGRIVEAPEPGGVRAAEDRGGVGAGTEVAGARSLRAFSQQIVVVTLGPGGALAVVGDDTVHRQTAFAVHVVDTVGAGDAFVAGFVVGRWFDAGLATALRWGCAAGSLATTRHGAQPSMPARTDVEALLRKDRREPPRSDSQAATPDG